jgi:hypothetical protein
MMDSIHLSVTESSTVVSRNGYNGWFESHLSTIWGRGFVPDLSWHALLSVALLYPIACSWLRFRRIKAARREFKFENRESMSSMTTIQAHSIVKNMSQFEFPLLYGMSLQFALFKVPSPVFQVLPKQVAYRCL